MDVSQIPAGSIVVGIDGSRWSDGALTWAVDQAALEQRALTIVHAIPSMGAQSMGDYASTGLDFVRVLDDAREFAKTLLVAAATRAHEQQPDVSVHEVLTVSDPRNILLDLSRHAALVVLGSRGRGPVASLLLGSVSASVSMHASCPVVVQRGDGTTPLVHRILVGYDGTDDSLPALEFASRMASLRASDLTVIHCSSTDRRVATVPHQAGLPDPTVERAVAESVAAMTHKFPGVQIAVHLDSGPAAEELSAAASDYDLVVVGHARMGHLRGLVRNSVATAVLEHSSGLVALVPSQPRA